jgi:type I restriction enzyme R subunit
VFLLDRVELGTQSLENYESYGGDSIAVEDTSSAATLITLLKNKHSTLIVTSLHKMSRVNPESTKKADLDIIGADAGIGDN